MLRLTIQSSTREGDLSADDDASLVEDDGLETAVTISLFTDAKATAEELVRAGLSQRGYWADAYDDASGALNTGSKLWLLEGRTNTPSAIAEAKAYADEALAWMVDEGVASKVENEITRLDGDAIGGVTRVYRPTDSRSPYLLTWERYFAVQ